MILMATEGDGRATGRRQGRGRYSSGLILFILFNLIGFSTATWRHEKDEGRQEGRRRQAAEIRRNSTHKQGINKNKQNISRKSAGNKQDISRHN